MAYISSSGEGKERGYPKLDLCIFKKGFEANLDEFDTCGYLEGC